MTNGPLALGETLAASSAAAGTQPGGPDGAGTEGGSPLPDPIFAPLRFRNLTVKNRIFRSNIAGRFDNEDGSLTQTRINWECRFASRGVGAIISSPVSTPRSAVVAYA